MDLESREGVILVSSFCCVSASFDSYLRAFICLCRRLAVLAVMSLAVAAGPRVPINFFPYSRFEYVDFSRVSVISHCGSSVRSWLLASLLDFFRLFRLRDMQISDMP